MNKLIAEIKISTAGWTKVACYAAAIMLLYYSALRRLVVHDWELEDYSHCALIPLVVLYLLWEKREHLRNLPSVTSLTGLFPFLLGIGFFWLGELGGEFFMLYLSLWLVIVGLCWIHMGREKIKSIGFPLVFMLAMFPFPNFINVRLTFWLQLISSRLGVWMLHLFGMSAYREGNVIDLGFTRLQVVEACSGLRYILPMMILSLILAYWYRAALWKKICLFLSAVPLAVLMNAFRIAMTGILSGTFGPEAAQGFFHGFSGWLLFVVAIPLLLLLMWGLKWLPPRWEEPIKATGSDMQKDLQEPEAKKKILQPVFVTALIILGATYVLSHDVEFRNVIPISRPFSEFPMQLGEWKGTTEVMEQQYRDVLYFSDYIIADYVNTAGKSVNFYVAYYQDQRKGESVHSPETCLPGEGWIFKDAGDVRIPLKDNAFMTVQRAVMEKDGAKQLTYFWFAKMGRVLTSLYQLKIYTFWDALIRHRTDAALVRIVTPIYPAETPVDAEKRLQGFTRDVVKVLGEFIPGN